MLCFYFCIPRQRSNFDSNPMIEVQPTNRTTSTVLPVQDNLTASDDHPPTYAQAIAKKETEINFTPSADLTETVSTDPQPSVPDLTQEIFTNPPNVDTPWVASTPPSPPGLTQYWTPETSPRDSQFSPLQTFFSPFE